MNKSHLKHKVISCIASSSPGKAKGQGAINTACAGLRGKLPKEINLPASVTVPFGSFEEVLNQAANKQIKQELEGAIQDIPAEKAEEALSKCRQLVMQVWCVTHTMHLQPVTHSPLVDCWYSSLGIRPFI